MNKKRSRKHQADINKHRNIINRPSMSDSALNLYHERYNNDTKELEQEFDRKYYYNDE